LFAAYDQAQGEAEVSKSPASVDTIYHIASITKTFTALTLVSLLESQSRQPNDSGDIPTPLTLNSKINSIIPDFSLPDDYATTHATLNDALAHVLGTGSHILSCGGEGYTLRDAVQSLRHLPMSAEFREKHQYLNIAYMALQHVIETLRGEDEGGISNAHQEYIWGPLGMESTYINLNNALREKGHLLAKGYTWEDGRLGEGQGTILESPCARDWPLVGHSGIVTSITDLAIYLHAIINKTLPFITPAGYNDVFRPRIIMSDWSFHEHTSTTLYAAGWMVSNLRSHKVISQAGGTSGFASKLLFFPQKKWGVAILANADINGTCVVEALASRLVDDFLGIPSAERQNITATMDGFLKGSVDSYVGARTRLYPDLSAPKIPASMPLASYAGRYHQPGYGYIIFDAVPVSSLPRGGSSIPFHGSTTQVLHAELPRMMDFTIDLEHVSGKDFIAWLGTRTGSGLIKWAKHARFETTTDGQLRCGIALEMFGGTELVWYDRVEEAVK
jgi:CubicO group peptidase (beta-lactamase class C family)